MIEALKYSQRIFVRSLAILCLILMMTYLLNIFSSTKNEVFTNAAYGDSSVTVAIQDNREIEKPEVKKVEIIQEEEKATPTPTPSKQKSEPYSATNTASSNDGDYTVQAVLGARRQVVIASGIDAKITQFKLESGDRFRRGDVLIQYDCTVDRGRLNEALSRQRVTETQLVAYQKLANLNSASNIELAIARENNEQNKAIITQIRGRLKSCQHIAPWSGRVTRKMASKHEYVQTGRVLMEITSHDPLRAEFLIPSKWLRWLNINTLLDIYIEETDKIYSAKVIRVFGEVDPVSQSVQVVAKMEKYHEELLPGMSGRATFTRHTAENISAKGFLGIKLAK